MHTLSYYAKLVSSYRFRCNRLKKKRGASIKYAKFIGCSVHCSQVIWRFIVGLIQHRSVKLICAHWVSARYELQSRYAMCIFYFKLRSGYIVEAVV